jgi:DNA-binding beta-propeller fold protein YncE
MYTKPGLWIRFCIGVAVLSLATPVFGQFAYVANQFSNDVSGYTINATTGTLTPIPGSPFAAVAAPLTVVVDPTGRFAYVANAHSANVSGYTINVITGVLTSIAGSPFAARVGPRSATTTPRPR